MNYRFLILDVFTETPFGGNQLGVIPDARGLSTQAMQALARELNFAETTFVLPAEDSRHTRRVRIFTPLVELPFAGHPTLGTAAALVHERMAPSQAGAARVTLEEEVGPIEVSVEGSGRSFRAELLLERPVEVPREVPEKAAVAAALSLDSSAIHDAWFASVGVRFCFVELAAKEWVDRATLDRHAWRASVADSWAPQLFFFAPEPTDATRLYARMFAPALGVEEDPATGSAAAALVASFRTRQTPSGPAQASAASEGVSLRIEQGVALGRPSVLHARAEPREKSGVRVRVQGGCVVVAEGTFFVPDVPQG